MGQRPYCRIEYDHDHVVSFLQSNDYPNAWTTSALSECLVVRVFDDDGTIGFFWGHWIAHGLMAFHVCVSKDRRAKWFDKETIRQLYHIAFWLGADELATGIEEGAANAHRIRSLLLYLGFTEEPLEGEHLPFYTINLWDTLYGIQTREDADREGGSEANPSGQASSGTDRRQDWRDTS